MGAVFHPGFYDEAMLKTLEAAFKDVYQTLPVGEQTDQLKITIAEKLMDFAKVGVIDAKELSARVLDCNNGTKRVIHRLVAMLQLF